MGNTHAPESAYPADFLKEWNARSEWRVTHDKKQVESIYVKLNLIPDKRPESEREKECGVIVTNRKKMFICCYKTGAEKQDPTFPKTIVSWTPQTNMKDFEVINPFTRNELEIAKGAGIGVLIIDALDCYIKLYWTEEGEIKPVYTIWPVRQDTKELLDADMGLGYEVLYVAGPDMKKQFHLKWNRHARSYEGKVFVPGLDKGLENFKTKHERKREKRSRSRSRSPKKNNSDDKHRDRDS